MESEIAGFEEAGNFGDPWQLKGGNTVPAEWVFT